MLLLYVLVSHHKRAARRTWACIKKREWEGRGIRHLALLHTRLALSQDGDNVVFLSDLGLYIVREVVGIIAGEVITARHRAVGIGRVHNLDVGLVVGINDGRNVKVSLAIPATKFDLSQHAGYVLVTLLDGVEVADKLVREIDSGVTGAVNLDRVKEVLVVIGSEVDGALHTVNGAEGNLTGAGKRGRSQKGQDRSGELHLEDGEEVEERAVCIV